MLIQSSSTAGEILFDRCDVGGAIPEEECIPVQSHDWAESVLPGGNHAAIKDTGYPRVRRCSRQATYALKLLQLDGELKIASIGKDESSGTLVTREYKAQGLVMLMLMLTTATDVDKELLNRCLLLIVNESREQT